MSARRREVGGFMTETRWAVGDRVLVQLPDRTKRRRWFSGVVTAVDEPGARRGVRVVLDTPLGAAKDCYATHGELRPEGTP